MNNNQVNFDPITGQPINQIMNTNDNIITNNISTQTIVETELPIQSISTNQIQSENLETQNNTTNTQQLIQSTPLVEQTKQDFINNVQVNSTSKKDEKKDGPNIVFIIILFVIIFGAIFFLFPYLQKNL